jgi:hypothetical protein
MAALALAFTRASGSNVDVATLRTLAIFCSAGLFVSILFASAGLDLSAGLF